MSCSYYARDNDKLGTACNVATIGCIAASWANYYDYLNNAEDDGEIFEETIDKILISPLTNIAYGIISAYKPRINLEGIYRVK